MDKISIIVPIYNVESYLEQCLNSIINQTYKNLEIILINDGSTDNSGKICDLYAKKDSRITVIHKKNGGLSDARNTGLSIATGEYIAFIDSDDFIELNMYQVLYRNAIMYNADIVWCNYYDFSNNSRSCPNIISKNNIYNLDSNPETFAKDLLYMYKMDAHVWCRLYKKSLFNSLKFPFNKTFEDIFILLPLLFSAKKIICITDTLYNYRVRNNSIVDICFNHKKKNILIDFIESNLVMAFDYKIKFPLLTESNLLIFDKIRLASKIVIKAKLSNYYIPIMYLQKKLLKEKLPIKFKIRLLKRLFILKLLKEFHHVKNTTFSFFR